ncbi:hypothetical protein DFH06DRAFT_1137202 [Mycena polygramma]|nr:hypothetical protein DFH06DRAFT_1137202 [Mycena polygramma]
MSKSEVQVSKTTRQQQQHTREGTTNVHQEEEEEKDLNIKIVVVGIRQAAGKQVEGAKVFGTHEARVGEQSIRVGTGTGVRGAAREREEVGVATGVPAPAREREEVGMATGVPAPARERGVAGTSSEATDTGVEGATRGRPREETAGESREQPPARRMRTGVLGDDGAKTAGAGVAGGSRSTGVGAVKPAGRVNGGQPSLVVFVADGIPHLPRAADPSPPLCALLDVSGKPIGLLVRAVAGRIIVEYTRNAALPNEVVPPVRVMVHHKSVFAPGGRVVQRWATSLMSRSVFAKEAGWDEAEG